MIGIRYSDDVWAFIDRALNNMPENKVVNDLADFHVTNDEIDFVDFLEEKEDIFLSYLPTKRKEAITDRSYFTNPKRQHGKIGKVLQKILANKDFPEIELKELVEAAQVFAASNKPSFVTVSGKDIRTYYLEDNYYERNNSELSKSCMRYKKCQTWLGLYEANKNVELAVALRADKVIARAFIWHEVEVVKSYNKSVCSENTGYTLLDRIYATSPQAKQYLLDNLEGKYDFRLTNAREPLGFTFTKGLAASLILRHKVTKMNFRKYPYVDTFLYGNPEELVLQNHRDNTLGVPMTVAFTGTLGERVEGL